MKNVLKIGIVSCCLASLYHEDVFATKKMDDFSESYIPQHKFHLYKNYKNGTELANTLEFDKTTKGFVQNTAKFQKKSKTKGKPLTKPANLSTDIFGWYTDNNRINVKYSEAKQIGKYGNGGLYVYMDPSFTSPQWNDAFDKGLAERAKGQNGIKVLGNLIELKINADARLYTTKLHKNDQGDYIAILDNEARHKEIRRKNNKIRLKIKDCYSVASKMKCRR
jgi:hypothetical protein